MPNRHRNRVSVFNDTGSKRAYKKPISVVQEQVRLGHVVFHESSQQYRLVPAEYKPADKTSPTSITCTEMRANAGEFGPEAQEAAERKIKWWRPSNAIRK